VSDSNITRRELPAVVKRAAELASLEGDAEEEISEDEVIRIAAELGLAERHVRQALYEGPTEEIEAGFLDQRMGIPRIMATRAVPVPSQEARRALEDYLVTREYLQIVRRQSVSTTFERADDAVSKVARAFSRSKKHCLAAAEGVEITMRDLQDGWTHVRLKAVYPDARKLHIGGATAGTVFLGGPVATAAGVIVGALANGPFINEVAVGLGAITGLSVFGAAAAGFWAIARSNFRKWRERSVNEANAVLDRLEKGDELRPPPAPWLRKLQLRFNRL
jgi:hypothetical protein